MIRAEVYGDSLLDLADEITDEARPEYLRKMRTASRLLRDKMTQILRASGTGVSAPGQPPGIDSGELAGSVRTIGTRVQTSTLGGPVVIRGGVEIGEEDDIEKVQSLEYGATGPDGRIQQPRSFVRPAEAAVEAEITRLASE